ncbi:MAG TPA: flagellar biosynthesis repressor FlbT [Rhodospirillaceae bacterium]|jgi:flagellar protein FlbT|nr:flagellar biosynthesis repressor FlbT [Alphaproteobacteria bacterium]HBH25884.1 flagellar biosynthesis repressor FlbT [Rhodospirillaceae bacterium]
MALVIDLKPGEKVLIGQAVITNDDQRTRLHIAGPAPILRHKDVLQLEDADTPCKKIYYIVQCMYIADDPKTLHDQYFTMIKDVQEAAPSTSAYILEINKEIVGGSYFRALKVAKKLIAYEKEILDRALR